MPHRSMVLFARPDWFVRKWWKLAIDTEVNSPVSFSTQKVKTQTFLVFKKTETRAKTMFQFADKIHQIFWFLYGKCIPVDDDSTKWRCEVMQFTSSLRDKINVFTFRKNQARARCNLSSHNLRGGFSFFPK